MTDENPYRPAEIAEPSLNQDSDDAKYQRIGGWLILLAFGLIFTAGGSLFVLVFTYVPIFRDGAYEVLTDPQSASYHPLWGFLLTFELIGNAALGTLAAVALVYMLRRSRRFPRLMLVYLIVRLLFVLADQGLASQIPAVADDWAGQGSQELVRGLVYTAIWTPYILRSVRVKKTFVH